MEEDSNNRRQTETPAGSPPGSEAAPSRTELEESRQQYTELNERYLRLAADFDNFRKRAIREQEQLKQCANEQLAVDMLEVIDNLDRAAKAEDSHLRQGLEQIRNLCSSILQRHGISPIESMDTAFDPEKHEAIAHIPSEKCEGMVVDELSKGYRMHDKVIRYARVAVSKGNGNKTEG